VSYWLGWVYRPQIRQAVQGHHRDRGRDTPISGLAGPGIAARLALHRYSVELDRAFVKSFDRLPFRPTAANEVDYRLLREGRMLDELEKQRARNTPAPAKAKSKPKSYAARIALHRSAAAAFARRGGTAVPPATPLGDQVAYHVTGEFGLLGLEGAHPLALAAAWHD